MSALIILFWIALFIVFYTYVGYGILLYILVKIKERLHPAKKYPEPESWPRVTLLIAAYNEELIVEEKMKNCNSLDYPAGELDIVWITDGTTDKTNELLSHYRNVTTLFSPERKGKTAALNRGIEFIKTPLTIFTDANTMLNEEAIKEIVKCFSDEKVGCVAGEKRIATNEKDNAAASGEGFYWKYESFLKKNDARLHTAVGAAGELFAIRTDLFEKMENDTLLDDFILSLRIAQKGYKIDYCDTAYAIESGSADMAEEKKRKVRIAAGGIQSILRLSSLFNIFRYKTLSFQYISHRVLRWSVTPVLLFLLFPLNLPIVLGSDLPLYKYLLSFQFLFYIIAWGGYLLEKRHIKIKIFYIPYYFVFMNVNVIKGFFYLRKNKGKGAWEKAKRASK